MKALMLKTILAGCVSILTIPSVFAQDKKDNKDVQQIIITKKGDSEVKTVIEITGNTITVNGKDAKDITDITVDLRRLKDINAFNMLNDRSWNFSMDNDQFSFFSADSNRAMLGVVTDSDNKGAKITSVTKESAAEKAGLKKGDIITKIGDQKIGDASDVSAAIRSTKPGQKVDITVLRDGKEQKIKTEMGKWKGVQINALATTPARPFMPPGMGGSAEGFPIIANASRPRLGLSIQDTENGKGVKVLEVETDGAAFKAGLKKDDVITHFNEKEVTTTDEVTRLMRENSNKASYTIRALRNGKTQNFEVVIPRKLKTANL